MALLPPLVPVHDRQAHPGPAIDAPPRAKQRGIPQVKRGLWRVRALSLPCGSGQHYDDTGPWGNNTRGVTRAGGYMGCHTFAFRLVAQSVGG